jgi:hypothetical protein
MANFNLLGTSPQGFVAGGTIANNVLVKLHSTEGQVVVTTAITDSPLGASMNSAVANGLISVQQFGKVKLTAKAAISLGAQVMPDAGGGGLIATAAGATAKSIGIALQAALAENDIIEVQLLVPAVNGPANS